MMIDWMSILLGCGLGLFAGLVPGLGPFTTLLLAFPIMLDLSVIQLLIVYSALITVSIYVGSVPATLYGIPGDSASMPVVFESRNLKDLKQVSQAISGAAFGGFFGSVAVAMFCLLTVRYLDNVKYFYSTPLFLSLLTMASVVIIWNSTNRKIVSLLLYMAGFVLGLVGYNATLNIPILVFNPYMYQGLPIEVVISTLFALPNIIFYWSYFKTNKGSRSKESYSPWTIYILNPVKSMFFTVVGFITGLVPGLTTILSSVLSYNIMSSFTKDPVKRITASETANNAGAFSMILPMLLFGLPITSSEALLLFFLEQTGFSVQHVDLGTLMKTLIYNFLIVNVIGLLLAWPLSNYVKYFYRINLKFVFGTVLLIIFGALMFSGWHSFSATWYFTLILILIPFGIALKNYDVLPLVFAFFISERFIAAAAVVYQLYF
jgi:putative tricarboxylic transport membrane protein